MVLAPGVFITSIPFIEADSISTLSTPTPALPITLRFLALSISSAVTGVLLLVIMQW